jgi:hypothetical protein
METFVRPWVGEMIGGAALAVLIVTTLIFRFVGREREKTQEYQERVMAMHIDQENKVLEVLAQMQRENQAFIATHLSENVKALNEVRIGFERVSTSMREVVDAVRTLADEVRHCSKNREPFAGEAKT